MITQAPELHELLDRRDDVLERRDLLEEEARDLAERIDAHRIAHRPTYPGPEAREGLRLVVGRVKDGTVSRTHHGDTVDTGGPAYLVHAWGSQLGGADGGSTHYVSLRHQAPYPLARPQGERLWRFSPAEVDAFRRMLAEEGFLIVEDWGHDGGRAFTVRYDPTWEPIRDLLHAAEDRFDQAILRLTLDGVPDGLLLAEHAIAQANVAMIRLAGTFEEALAALTAWLEELRR